METLSEKKWIIVVLMFLSVAVMGFMAWLPTQPTGTINISMIMSMGAAVAIILHAAVIALAVIALFLAFVEDVLNSRFSRRL